MSRRGKNNKPYPTYGGLSIRDGLGEAYRANNTATRTSLIAEMHLRRIREMVMTRFKWSGLPNSVDERFLEKTLLETGLIIFYWDTDYDRFLAVQGTQQGLNNQYDNPVRFQTVSYPAYQGKTLSYRDCVPIYASYDRGTMHDVMHLYATRLAEIDRTMEIVAKNMRINKVASADESQRLTVANALRQIDQGEPTIYTSAGFNIGDAIQILDMGVDPKILHELRIEKNQIWGELKSLIGITNSNSDKKERLVEDEATGNDGEVVAARNAAIKPRLEACEMINRMYPDLVAETGGVHVEWANPEEIMHGMSREFEEPHQGVEVGGIESLNESGGN